MYQYEFGKKRKVARKSPKRRANPCPNGVTAKELRELAAEKGISIVSTTMFTKEGEPKLVGCKVLKQRLKDANLRFVRVGTIEPIPEKEQEEVLTLEQARNLLYPLHLRMVQSKVTVDDVKNALSPPEPASSFGKKEKGTHIASVLVGKKVKKLYLGAKGGFYYIHNKQKVYLSFAEKPEKPKKPVMGRLVPEPVKRTFLGINLD